MLDMNSYIEKKLLYKAFLCSFFIIFILVLQGCTGSTKDEKNMDYNPYFSSEPSFSQLNLEYTYVKLGEYPQTIIKKDELTDQIVNLDYDANGVGNLDREETNAIGESKKIFRVKRGDTYEYYWIEKILWKIIECDEEKAVLWSDCIIDSRNFYDEEKNDNTSKFIKIKWSDSGLRDWLNEEFYNKAFSEEERKSILEQEYENYSSEFGYPMGEKYRKKYTVDLTKDRVSIRDFYSLSLFQYDCPYKIKGMENKVVPIDISLYLKCDNTDYAMNQFVNQLAKDEKFFDRYVPGYWTRTSIEGTKYLEYVDISASTVSLSDLVDENINRNYYLSSLGVRPIIVIKKSDVQSYISQP